MSKYFNWPSSLKRLVRFDAARAEDVNDALDELTAGLDQLDLDTDRSIKLPIGTADQTLAMTSGQRANLLLAFDSSGNIAAVAGGGRFRGDWLTATAYAISDYFRDPVSKNIYSVVTAHTSGVLATDISAGRAQLAINVEDVEAAKTAAQNAAAAAVPAASTAVASAADAIAAKDAAEDARDMSQTYAALAGAAAGLPALAGQALKNLRVKSDETGVEWMAEAAPGSMARAAKTSAYTLLSTDKGTFIDCSGTWTLGFTAAATLGAGWWCYVRNIGTGTITADPNGSELIDGVTSGAIRPGMTLLVQCDGTSFHCLRVGPHVAMEALTSGTSWTAPLGVRSARLRQAGGGAGGAAAAGGSSGSAGGYLEAYIATTPGASYTYAIGAAGAAGGAGGTTTFTANGITYTSTGAGATPVFGQSAPGSSSGGSINARGNTGDAGQAGGPNFEGASSPIGYGSGGRTNNPGTAGGIVLEY